MQRKRLGSHLATWYPPFFGIARGALAISFAKRFDLRGKIPVLKISIPCESQLKFWKRIKDSSLIDSGAGFFMVGFWAGKKIHPSTGWLFFLHGGINHWKTSRSPGIFFFEKSHPFASREASRDFSHDFSDQALMGTSFNEWTSVSCRVHLSEYRIGHWSSRS